MSVRGRRSDQLRGEPKYKREPNQLGKNRQQTKSDPPSSPGMRSALDHGKPCYRRLTLNFRIACYRDTVRRRKAHGVHVSFWQVLVSTWEPNEEPRRRGNLEVSRWH